MNLFYQLERLTKSQLWFFAVIISIFLSEMIVSVMDILLQGKVTADYLLTGLVASAFVASLVVGIIVFFLERLASVQDDNSYLNDIIHKLNQLTQALRDNDDAYRSILATTLDGFWVVNSEGKLLDVNDRYTEQSGYSRAELLNMHILDVEAMESVKDHATHIQRVITDGGDQFESVHRRKDGTVWQVEISATYLDSNGGVFYVFLRDITERKQAENKLREKEEMLRAITDNTNTVIFIKDLEGRCVLVNRLFEKLFQVKNAAIKGKTDYEIFPKELADKFTQDDQTVLRSGQPLTVEETVPTDNGIHTYITVKFPLRNIFGAIYAVCGIATDITERKQFEAILREREFLFHTQFDLGNLGMAITSPEKGWLRVNPKLCQMLGYSEQELTRLTWFEMTYPQDLEPDLCQFQRMLNGEIDNYELDKRFIRKDGNIIYTHLTVACYRDDGKPQLVIAGLMDISERKKQEEEIRRLSDSELNKAKLEAERASQAKSDFLASMSHELFTPMNAVLGFAQILDAEDLTEEQHAHVDAILTGGYQLLDLIKEVLDFSIIESEKLDLKLKKLDLATLVQGCMTLMQPLALKKGITIVNNLGTACHVTVVADSLRMKQLLLNLLSNAIKYNRVDGCITLACEFITPQLIKISITDTGIGLSEEQLAKLFQPFERLSAKNSNIEGAGLGLCISKKLIEAMNGRIGVECILGKGCCFWIEIPLAS